MMADKPKLSIQVASTLTCRSKWSNKPIASTGTEMMLQQRARVKLQSLLSQLYRQRIAGCWDATLLLPRCCCLPDGPRSRYRTLRPRYTYFQGQPSFRGMSKHLKWTVPCTFPRTPRIQLTACFPSFLVFNAFEYFAFET